MRISSILLAACAVAAPARAGDWPDVVNDWLRQSGLTGRQQQDIRNQVRQIEQRRKKEDAKRRKEDQKRSLQSIKEAYEKGKKAYQEKRFSAAYLHFQDVAGSTLKQAAKMAAEAKSKVLEIEAMALARLEQAKILLLQNQPLKAAELLQQVVEDYPYCDAAAQARSRLQSLRSVPSVAASMHYGEGKAHEEAENYGTALEIYEDVMQRWPNELAALRAKVAADGICADSEKMKIVREAKKLEADRVCPTLLNLAKSFIMNYERERDATRPNVDTMRDLRAQAIEKLNRVIKGYPDTHYAQEAQRLLEKLTESAALAP